MGAWLPITGETPIDPSGLKPKGVTNRAELNVVEAKNILKAHIKYLQSKPNKKLAPFDMAWCERLHKEMFGDVWLWAGQIRTRNLNLGIPFGSVRDSLATLLADLPTWSTYSMDIVEQATRLHCRAVRIHPFENGNGRWSRMLANIWLRLNDHSAINWPEAVIGTESTIRTEYIAAIQQADAGEFRPLIEIHRRYVTNPAAS
jgi:Fic-DOC domain mobile mystery protein B